MHCMSSATRRLGKIVGRLLLFPLALSCVPLRRSPPADRAIARRLVLALDGVDYRDVAEARARRREGAILLVLERLPAGLPDRAARAALADGEKAERIEMLRTMMQAALEARRRVLLEMNVARDRLAAAEQAAT